MSKTTKRKLGSKPKLKIASQMTPLNSSSVEQLETSNFKIDRNKVKSISWIIS